MSQNWSSKIWDTYLVSAVLSSVSKCISVGKKDKFYMDKETIIQTINHMGVSFVHNPEHFFEKRGIDLRTTVGNYLESIKDLAQNIQEADTKERLLDVQKTAESLSDALYPYN